MFKEYVVWKQNHSNGVWSQTSHKVKARTDKEAQSKVKKLFSNCGFSSMSLVAILGHSPTK